MFRPFQEENDIYLNMWPWLWTLTYFFSNLNIASANLNDLWDLIGFVSILVQCNTGKEQVKIMQITYNDKAYTYPQLFG